MNRLNTQLTPLLRPLFGDHSDSESPTTAKHSQHRAELSSVCSEWRGEAAWVNRTGDIAG